jgi:NADH-quinone oxidoreductase subunit M
VGEFLILLGAFESHPWAASLSATGVILAAVYMLWMVQRVFFGPCDRAENRSLLDVNLREMGVLASVVIPIVWLGVQPGLFTSRTDASIAALMTRVESKREKSWTGSGETAGRPVASPAHRMAGSRKAPIRETTR